jgi:hypothetical protein
VHILKKSMANRGARGRGRVRGIREEEQWGGDPGW